MTKPNSKKVRTLEIIELVKNKYGSNRPEQGIFFAETELTEWEIRKFFGSFGGLMVACGYERTYAGQPINSPFGLDQETKLNLKIKKLTDENKRITELLRETEKHALTSEKIQDLIGSTNTFEYSRSPGWLTGSKTSPKNTGTPFLLLSDIHFDEVVSPEQIEHCNEYNREIATARIKRVFERTVALLKSHLVAPKYDGIVCALGGDLLSGNIHEELAETNEVAIAQSIFALTDLLINGIGELADAFGKVFVPCVVGNHGRLHKKPRCKNRVYDNFEWIIYQNLARYFKNDPRVSFMIPDGADAIFNIYNKHICLTHGDQFRGGNGIAGIFSPIMLGMARKQKRQSAIKKPFDIIAMGHWHQLILMEQMIVNGSIKGYDEYAYLSNFPFELPQQALVIFHKDRGMTYRIPVNCV